MIEIERLSYTYPGAARPVLRDFSARFGPGEVVALTGPNGCGKTTLAQLITGMLRPDRGRVLIDGEDMTKESLFAIGRRLGYIRQNPNRQLFCATVREEVAFGLERLGLSPAERQARAHVWLRLFRLEERLDAQPLLLSLGEKQRLALACVLSLGAPYLLLDEPTGGLDPRCRRLLGRELLALAEQGRGLIVISHEREFIRRYCSRELRIC